MTNYGGLSLGNAESPPTSSHYLPVVLCLGLGLCEISSLDVTMSTVGIIVQVLFR